MANQRVSTGIEKLDELIGGGLIKGRSYLIAGEPGTGKTLFSLQYVLNGIQKGENGIYVSIDEKPEHVIEDAKSMGWDIEAEIKKEKMQILDVTPYFAKARGEKKELIDVDQIASDLTRYVKKIGAKRLVIDPIAPLVSTLEDISEIRSYIKQLIFGLEEKTGCTVLLTSHVPVGTARLSQYDIEEFVVSGIFLLKLVKPEKKYVRTLFVRKMRGTATDLSEYTFDIVKEKGLVLRQAL